MQFIWFILGIFMFIGLILAHEWGHYYFARKNGIIVDEFGLGFPPRAWGKKLKSGMVVSLNWLPLGGFVKLRGENDDDDRKGSYGAASLSAKIKVLLAGVAVNALIGVILLTIVAAINFPVINERFKLPSGAKLKSTNVVVTNVEVGSPASQAGLKFGDYITAVDGQKVSNIEEVRAVSGQKAGKPVSVEIIRSGKPQTKTVTLNSQKTVDDSLKTNKPVGYIGIVSAQLDQYQAGWSSPIVALSFTKDLTVMSIQAIGHALGGLGSTIAGLVTGNEQAKSNGTQNATQDVGGPVAMANALWNGGNFGLAYMLWIIGFISISLAILNILPVPALDGGRLLVTIIYRKILNKKLTKEVENAIHGTGMAVLLMLFVLITIVDVKRF